MTNSPQASPERLAEVAKWQHEAKVELFNASDAYTAARHQLHQAIRDADATGLSLRDIAKATGIYSHEQIRRILAGAA
jgi:hypothetical protein